MQDEKPGLLSCSSPPDSALEMLASLVGQQYAAVAKLLKGAIGSESHDCVRVRGFSQREVHHFWAEGLAISMERGRVYLVEAFGDDHPFHRRAPNAELYPSLFFGASSAEARKILGEPSDEFADSGWLRYTDWPQRDTGCLGGGKRTHTTLALQFNEAKEGEKAEKGEKGEKEEKKDKEKKEKKEKMKSVDVVLVAGDGGAGSSSGADPAASSASAAGGSADGGSGGGGAVGAGAAAMSGAAGASDGKEEKKEKKDKDDKKDKKKEKEGAAPAPEDVVQHGLQGVRIDTMGSKHSTKEELSKKLIRVAGHDLNFFRLSEGMIVKQSTPAERQTYEAIVGTPLAPFTARCFRSVDRESHVLLYIEDLTAAYSRPCVMDVKMGSRTFQEKEADNPKRRLDLKDKMLKHEDGPSALTPEELEIGVTKLRYMQFREACSTSQAFGFRVEGIHLDKGKYSVLKSLKHKADLLKTLSDYVQGREDVARALTGEFEKLRTALESSEWFMSHEVVSSSLLVIYDGAVPPMAPPMICMIDFAHTFSVTEYGLQRLKHRGGWSKGNHEEGYLDGLDSLVNCFKEVASSLGSADVI